VRKWIASERGAAESGLGSSRKWHHWREGRVRRRKGRAHGRGSGEGRLREIHGERRRRFRTDRVFGGVSGFFAAVTARYFAERVAVGVQGRCRFEGLRRRGGFFVRFDTSAIFFGEDVRLLQIVVGVHVELRFGFGGLTCFFLARGFRGVLGVLSAGANGTEEAGRK